MVDGRLWLLFALRGCEGRVEQKILRLRSLPLFFPPPRRRLVAAGLAAAVLLWLLWLLSWSIDRGRFVVAPTSVVSGGAGAGLYTLDDLVVGEYLFEYPGMKLFSNVHDELLNCLSDNADQVPWFGSCLVLS